MKRTSINSNTRSMDQKCKCKHPTVCKAYGFCLAKKIEEGKGKDKAGTGNHPKRK